MSKPKRIPQLEEFASATIGDDKTPDLFFVSDNGSIVTVTRNFDLAYRHWLQLAARYSLTECALENRTFGVLASVEPAREGSTAMVRLDYTGVFKCHVRKRERASK